MAEDLTIIQGSKEEIYPSLIPQIKGLLEGEPDLIANLANVVAALKEQFGWLWVGCGLVFISSGEKNWCLAPSRDPLPAPVSKREEAYAEPAGRKRKRSLFRM